MKKKMRKLSLNKETLRALELREVQGAFIPEPGTIIVAPAPASRRFPCSNEISICIYCTTPIDGCPGNPTIA